MQISFLTYRQCRVIHEMLQATNLASFSYSLNSIMDLRSTSQSAEFSLTWWRCWRVRLVVWEQVKGADPWFSLDPPHLLANLSFFLSLQNVFLQSYRRPSHSLQAPRPVWRTGEKETNTGKLQDFKGNVACLVA